MDNKWYVAQKSFEKCVFLKYAVREENCEWNIEKLWCNTSYNLTRLQENFRKVDFKILYSVIKEKITSSLKLRVQQNSFSSIIFKKIHWLREEK